jgi:hypothetical protein
MKEGETMRISHFAVVLSLILGLSFALSVNEAKAGDSGMAGGVLSPDPSALTNGAQKALDKSKVEGSVNSGALGACQNEQTIPDTTLIQRWQLGVPNPGGTPPAGWYDIIGKDVFNTTQMNVIWSGTDVLFQIFTNFPETGADSFGGDNGTVIGYPYIGGYYRIADLAFDFERDGVWDEGVVLFDHGAIPYDPSHSAGQQPPGYGQPADTFISGNRYSASAWFSADDIHRYHSGYAGKYDMADPKTPAVWMRLGTLLGAAQITWTNLGTVDPTYRIDVLLKGVNTSGKWNKFNVLWGTANCANDVIAGQASKPCPDKVPGMNGWSALVTGLLILGSGIWILIRRRSS